MATDYGKRLRAARLHAKLTQMGLAEKTGISQSTISTAERENQGSSDTHIYAKACGVDAHWLATGEGAMLLIRGESSAGPATAPVIDLDGLLSTLSGYLADVHERHRASLVGLFSDLIHSPDDKKILGSIKMMLDNEAFVQPKKA